MEELKPCPFCGAPARFRVFGPADDYLMIECGKEDGACVSMQVSEASEWAHKYLAEKWNNRPGEDEWERMYTNLAIEQSHEIWAGAAPENKPLTLEELRSAIENKPNGWLWLEALTDSRESLYQRNEITYRWSNITNYGKTWLAYARKPEGSTP